MSIYMPGIYQISNAEYQCASGLSRSGIMRLKKSALHYHAKYHDTNVEEESTEALLIGQALDTYLLNNKNFHNLFHVADKPDLRSPKNREEWEAVLFAAGKKNILSSLQRSFVENLAKAVLKDETISKVINSSKIQQAIFWRDKESGALLKSCPDLVKANLFSDLKTAADASDKSFINAMAKYGYHIQAAMAIDGWKEMTGETISEFWFLVVEKTAPFATAIKMLVPEAIEQGRKEYKFYAQKYMECETKHIWPSYPPSFISLPAFYS